MYSDKVIDHFQNPRNVGEIEDASGVGTVGNAKCGDMMRLYLKIAEAMKLTNKAVMEALDGLPPEKEHCSLLAEETLHAALWDYAEKHGIKIPGLVRPVQDIEDRMVRELED